MYCRAVFVSSVPLGPMATSGVLGPLVPALSGRKVEEVGLRRLGRVDEYTCARCVGHCLPLSDPG